MASSGLATVYTVLKPGLAPAQIDEAGTEVANLAQYVTQYYVFQGEYPETLHQLTDPPGGLDPIVQEVPTDPWGHPYQYRKTGEDSFELFAMGPDGRPFTEDDVYPEGRGPQEVR